MGWGMESGGLGLVFNLAVRHCLLEFLYAFVGDFGVAEVEPREIGQTFQVLQDGVGHSGVVEVEPSQIG